MGAVIFCATDGCDSELEGHGGDPAMLMQVPQPWTCDRCKADAASTSPPHPTGSGPGGVDYGPTCGARFWVPDHERTCGLVPGHEGDHALGSSECACEDIRRRDPRRHFKGCPLRRPLEEELSGTFPRPLSEEVRQMIAQRVAGLIPEEVAYVSTSGRLEVGGWVLRDGAWWKDGSSLPLDAIDPEKGEVRRPDLLWEPFEILRWAESRPGVMSLLRALRDANYDETGTEFLQRVVDRGVARELRGELHDSGMVRAIEECSCTFRQTRIVGVGECYERLPAQECQVHGLPHAAEDVDGGCHPSCPHYVG